LSIKIDELLAREEYGNFKKRRPPDKESFAQPDNLCNPRKEGGLF